MSKQNLKIAIADNNSDFLNRLCTKTDWEAYGFELTGTAESGKAAADMVQDSCPDLLFVSSELLKEGKLVDIIEKQNVQTVVLLEPGEKAAETSIKPFKYLVRPFSASKMSGELRRISSQVRGTISMDVNEGELSVLTASLLMNFFDPPVSDDEMVSELAHYGFDMGDHFLLKTIVAYSPQQGFLMPDIGLEINTQVRKIYSCGSFILGNRVVMLIVSNDGFERLDEVLDIVKNIVSEKTGSKCEIGISDAFAKSGSLLSSFLQAVDSTSMARKKAVEEAGELPDVLLEEVRNVAELDALLISSNRSDLEKYLIYHLRPEVSETGTLQILMTACTVFASSLGEPELERMLRMYDLTNIISETNNLSLIKHRVYQFCLACNDLLAKRRVKDNEKLANMAIDMINRYYMEEELSLNTISKYLHVTPNYLSFLIKKFKNDTFSSILIAKRMEESKKLLETSTMKVAEIAEVVGYSDQHYFSHSFKNYYGISPLKMRKQSQNKK